MNAIGIRTIEQTNFILFIQIMIALDMDFNQQIKFLMFWVWIGKKRGTRNSYECQEIDVAISLWLRNKWFSTGIFWNKKSVSFCSHILYRHF